MKRTLGAESSDEALARSGTRHAKSLTRKALIELCIVVSARIAVLVSKFAERATFELRQFAAKCLACHFSYFWTTAEDVVQLLWIFD